jgi:hypothetical protein
MGTLHTAALLPFVSDGSVGLVIGGISTTSRTLR